MAVMLSLVLVSIIVILVSYGLIVNSRKYKYTADFYCPSHIPLIGLAHEFVGNRTDIMNSLIRLGDTSKHNGFIKFWLGPFLYIALSHPPSVGIVLNQELDKSCSEYGFFKPFMGNSLFPASLPIWRRHRKILSTAFNQRLLNQFVDAFAKHSNILVEKLGHEVGKGEFDAEKYISSCALDILCETVMGVEMCTQNNENQSYITALTSEMSLVAKRIFQIWLRPQWLFNLSKYAKVQRQNLKILHGFSNAIIQRKIAEFEKRQAHVQYDVEFNEKSTRCKAFLDLMVELTRQDENGFTDKELREETDGFLTGGFDSSSITISYVLMMLGCHPDVQEKVVDELRDVYGDSKRPAVKEDLPKMKYLERVIKETMRLLPAVPIIERNLTQDVKLENHILPAGVGCIICIYAIHRDKKVWGENADDFDPDNFLPENCARRHPCSFMPFSAGPRNCIGQQFAMMSMKVILSSVLRSYKIHSKIDYKNIQLQYGSFMTPKNGFHITAELRM